jgi:hypothetical protein
VSGREIWVVGSMPARLDERLVLEMPGDGSTRGVGVRVVESVPVLTDDVLRHRLRLEVTDAGAAPSAGGNDRTGGR